MTPRLSLFVMLAALGSAAFAGEYRLGDLVVKEHWMREMPPVAETAVAYFRVENRGDEGDRLVSVHSPLAEEAELHLHEMEDGVMVMQRLPSAEVPAEGTIALAPGGLHVMLVGLAEAPAAGERFPMTLHFERAGTIEVQVRVRSFEEAAHSALSVPDNTLPA